MDDSTRAFIFFAFVLAVLIAAGVLAFIDAAGNEPADSIRLGCPNDTRVCPDNSTAGRMLPRCEFKPC